MRPSSPSPDRPSAAPRTVRISTLARMAAAGGVVAVAAMAGPGSHVHRADAPHATLARVPAQPAPHAHPAAVAQHRTVRAATPAAAQLRYPVTTASTATVKAATVDVAEAAPAPPPLAAALRRAIDLAWQPYLPALHAAGATRLSTALAGSWRQVATRRDQALATRPPESAPARAEVSPPDALATDGAGHDSGLRTYQADAISRPDLATVSMNLSGVNTASTTYTRLRTWVESAVAGSPGYDFHAGDAAIMYRITRDARYCTTAVGLVERQVASAEASIAAQSNPAIAADSYLEVGPMIADLSLTYSTCGAQMTSAQRTRWAAYAEQAIWNVWNYASARWGTRSAPWSGWSVTNPGNNYHYSFLEATMYWALASGSNTWMNFLASNKLPALQDYYKALPGGGSLEGTGYGTAQMRLFEIYRLWRDSTGNDLSLASTHARNSILYWTHATVPAMNQFAPIGDQSRSSIPDLYDYQRHLVLEARNLTYDAGLRRIADWWLNNISIKQMTNGSNLRYDAVLPVAAGGAAPTDLSYVAQGTGMVFARSAWTTDAMWMAYIAGPYTESHAHQDQGAFTLYSRGTWLAVTENIWSRSGIQQGPDVHNVLRFERSNTSAQQCASPSGDRIVHQCADSYSTATVTPGSNGALSITSNLTDAYNSSLGTSPYVLNWQRKLDFANRSLLVQDNFSVASGTSAIFQVQVPVAPTVSGNTITAGGLRIRVLQPASPTISVRNWSTFNSGEFTRGYRVDIAGGTSVYQVEFSEI